MKLKEHFQRLIHHKIYSFLIHLSKIILTAYTVWNIQPKTEPPLKKLLIIKTDAIGDYIIFRNFIEEIRKSKKYENYGIYFLGNKLWKNLFDNLDKKSFKKSFFINRENIYKRKYIQNLISKLNKEKFETSIYCVSNREFIIDNIIKKINIKNKIGYAKKSMHQGNFENRYSGKIYTKLINTKKIFHFDESKEFIEKIINDTIFLEKPNIKFSKKQTKNKHIVINPGASHYTRRWNSKYYAKLIDCLIKKYGTKIYIVGSKNELDLGLKIKAFSRYPDKIKVFSGKKLYEVLKLIDGSKGVVSNETSTIHFAIALNKKVYCISNGDGYGLAHPYKNYNNAIYFYPKNFNKLNKSKRHSLDINDITPESIIKKIKF